MIVELKAIKEITSIEEAQVVNYLRASGSRIGLVINFGAASLQFKRVANMELLAPKRVPRIDDLRPVPPSTFLEAQHPSVNLSNL